MAETEASTGIDSVSSCSLCMNSAGTQALVGICVLFCIFSDF